MVYGGIRIESLGKLFGLDLSLGYLAVPVTIFLIIGIINAINMSDGLDGLAGGICVLAFLSFQWAIQ